MSPYQVNIRIWYQSSFTITVASALCHGSTDICTCKRLIPTSLRKPTAEPGRCTRRRPSMWGLENIPPAPEERDLFFILTLLWCLFWYFLINQRLCSSLHFEAGWWFYSNKLIPKMDEHLTTCDPFCLLWHSVGVYQGPYLQPTPLPIPEIRNSQLDSRTLKQQTPTSRASVGLSGLCLTSVRDEPFIRGSFWESINLLPSTANIRQRPSTTSAECIPFPHTAAVFWSGDGAAQSPLAQKSWPKLECDHNNLEFCLPKASWGLGDGWL